ncbi:SCO7460 family lipoprotein [Streptomyces sp. ITFR-16]|uniref:SCO7460 family lipoprotein n=1 Tax=Streptomyces sp. ITFR-16 TaxID=3075198 RepID=UPI002888F9F8|nr:hypothetical protein [Streptomyces sp. ITFR-16]WNI20616.1 hypothetical protein RLT58_01210 [Streptomyces sp. ITFR-16]
MGGSTRARRWRAVATGALVGSVALVLGGCGVVTTKEDRRFAVKLADEHYPGVLRVIGAHTLFPQASGSEITFAVTDDPDAVVRIRVDAKAGTCNTHACGGVLDEAVERGRRDADLLRVLVGTFERCGHEVIGVEPSTGAPWIVAEPTDATVAPVLKDIGACVRQWVEAREAKDPSAKKEGASVNLVSRAVAEKRPTGKASQPTAMRLSATPLLAALHAHPYFAASYAVVDGRIDTTGSARIVRPFTEQQKFARTVQSGVKERLRTTHPRVQISDFDWVWQLEPGTVDRFTGYVLYCEEPDGEKTCLGDRAVVVTTDGDGRPIGELRPVGKVREGRGPLRLPPL